MCIPSFVTGLVKDCRITRRAFTGSSLSYRSSRISVSQQRRSRIQHVRRKVISASVADTVGQFNVKVLVIIAEGSEEIEAVTAIDTLRRTSATVTVVSCGDYIDVKMARGTVIKADKMMKDVVRDKDEYQAIVIPGGPLAAEKLSFHMDLIFAIRDSIKRGDIIAASCSAPPTILAKHGLLEGRRATCFPDPQFEYEMDGSFVDEKVVVDGNFITSQGPATALEWSLAIADKLFGDIQITGLREAMLVSEPVIA